MHLKSIHWISTAIVVLAAAFWAARPAPAKPALYLNGALLAWKDIFGYPPGEIRLLPTVTGLPKSLSPSNAWLKITDPSTWPMPP